MAVPPKRRLRVAVELRHRIAFDKRQSVSDGFGNEQSTFAEQFIVPGAVQARFGGEEVMAARLQGQQPITIVVRQSTQTRLIKEDWQARDVRSGQVYAIKSIVDPDDKREWLEILVQTGAAS